jgi:transposase InsO family protein
VRYAFIQAHRDEFEVSVMCDVMNVSASGYYGWRARPDSERARAKRVLQALIRQTFEDTRKTYGSPRLYQHLKQNGVRCGEHRVARLMRDSGLVARHKRQFKPQTTDSSHGLPVAVNLLNQDFSATRPNQKWVADITFVATQEGWLYLAVVLDVFSRMVVGWAMSERCDAELVHAALCMAHTRRCAPPGLIVHSDRGSQYASQGHRELLDGLGFLHSMSRKGNCYDNAMMESFFSSLKIEEADRDDKEIYLTRAIARTYLFDYIETFYNRQRLHSSLGYMSPANFEAAAVALLP